MKIALQNELPGEAQFRQLISSMPEEAGSLPAYEYETLRQCAHIIAAYDQDLLIGLGRLKESRTLECTILPNYRNREIEYYMRKLLSVAPEQS